jgi:dUTP pyrophosphatase
MLTINCKRKHPDAQLPEKSSRDELGWDFFCVADEDFREVGIGDSAHFEYTLFPGCTKIFRTGVSVEFVEQGRMSSGIFDAVYGNNPIPEHTTLEYGMLLWDRSGMGAKKRIHRFAGVIDPTYRGEVMACLSNQDHQPHIIRAGDKIVQGIITKVYQAEAKWTDELSETERGEKGFGSSGD